MVSHSCLQATLASLLLLAVLADATFCPDGMSKPNFTKGEIVEVLYAQAPLFSLDPKIGQHLSLINLFHSSVVLAQGVDTDRQYWTLEFGFMNPSPLAVMVPQLVANESTPGGTSLVWRNDAKYCLTYGLLHGRHHWTTHLDIVMSTSAEDVTRVFDDFVIPLNNSKPGNRPQYHNFKVAHAGFFGKIEKTFIEDLTCNHGALWFIHYLSTLGNPIPPDFQFKGTVALVNAWGVKQVDTTSPWQWKNVVNYYRKLSEVVSSNKSHVRKLLDVVELVVERRYAYDPNSRNYYELIGNFFPWVVFQYDSLTLTGPPWIEAEKPRTMIV
jgi:hypothetical protein